MFRLMILSCYFLLITGKNINMADNFDYNDLDDIRIDSNEYYDYDVPASAYENGDVWFLNLKDDWNSLTLRNANENKTDQFYSLNGYLINEHILHQTTETIQKVLTSFKPKIDSNSNTTNSKNANESLSGIGGNLAEAQKKLWQIINKIMIHEDKSDINLVDSCDDGADLELFFKGPYCALIVTMPNKIWNFFMPPPSLLSAWHAEVNKDKEVKSVALPEDIKEKLYKYLIKLLLLSFSFPA